MSKIGKISSIVKDYRNSSFQTIDSELAKKGMNRYPGTGVFKYPFKEGNGKYRTGLDPDATYIKRIEDNTERELEIERVTKLRQELEEALDVDLGPRSQFWNYGKSKGTEDQNHVTPWKLYDGENVFDLSVPYQAMTFAWLRVHPTIASSLEAYQLGKYPSDTKFYVVDEAKENALVFKKKQQINKAIVKLDEMIPSKRLKVARLLGLPMQDDTPQEFVYNAIDNILKQSEFKKGKHKGMDPIRVFTVFADMNDNLLHIKDLIGQAVEHSIYKEKAGGRIFEGEFKVAETAEELAKHLADPDNQEDLIILEEKLKTKKVASV